jgi:glycerophosphoryl diester phosphodiesterase
VGHLVWEPSDEYGPIKMFSMTRPLLLGHRGARSTRSIPENTLASFDLALEHGCDGFEFDVRQTGDGRCVICHDPEIHGVEIARAEAGDLADLAVLEQVLARYQDRAFLDIEIKIPAIEKLAIQCVRTHRPQRGYVVSSFLPEVLLKLREFDAGLPLGLICETKAQLTAWDRLPVQFVIPHHTLTDINVCDAVHAAGRKLLTWTVNRREEMLRFREMGVDGIISDDTEMLGKLRSEG